jgi:hypothetical protein
MKVILSSETSVFIVTAAITSNDITYFQFLENCIDEVVLKCATLVSFSSTE